MPQVARGIRSNNPGNLDRSDIAWQGMAADQSSDPRFVVFTSPQYGIRALAKTLLTYQNVHNLRTVRKIIGRYAPKRENDTDAYVNAVSMVLGVSPDAEIDVDQVAVMLPLVRAIITHENGAQPYSERQLRDGLRMAGVSDAKGPSPVKRIAALCTAGCTAVGGAVSDAVTDPDKLHQAQGMLQPLAAFSPILKGLFVAVTVTILGLTMFGLTKAHKQTGA